DSIRRRAQFNFPAAQLDSISWVPRDIIDCTSCEEVMTSPLARTEFILSVTDQNGCRASDTLEVFVEQTQKFFMPNAFSPNNDGINDHFFIPSNNRIETVSAFRIVNRWGSLVYSAENFPPGDPGFGWDGTLNGQALDSGVYLYIVEIQLKGGERIVLQGDVTLMN
ncbi:MAG: gliding motility-associated C-terminal domain-containing protein, partial [Saprospiraceae bacterium]|nr:gliding motility-associated C-terminal domain-containing protein [Saprospiraceae bacterium]